MLFAKTMTFGYFNDSDNNYPEYSQCVEGTKWDGQTQFIQKLLQVQEYLKNTGFYDVYRGFSMCRLCNCMNGSAEYYVNVYEGKKKHSLGYFWPSGYIHYIQYHNIRPPQKFIDFITNFNRA